MDILLALKEFSVLPNSYLSVFYRTGGRRVNRHTVSMGNKGDALMGCCQRRILHLRSPDSYEACIKVLG